MSEVSDPVALRYVFILCCTSSCLPDLTVLAYCNINILYINATGSSNHKNLSVNLFTYTLDKHQEISNCVNQEPVCKCYMPINTPLCFIPILITKS